MKHIGCLLLILAGVSLAGCTIAGKGVTAVDLRCEYLVNPQGIDATKPRMSWTLQSSQRGQRQTAYQIMVAGSKENLKKNLADLWDCGKVDSDQSVNVEYEGKELASQTACWWKVRVWDKECRAGGWSKPGHWTMGLLKPSDWQGQWICAALPEDKPKDYVPPLPWLRKNFTLTEKPGRAIIYISALGYYELYINGEKVDDYVLTPAVSDYSKRALYLTHDIRKYLVKGENCIALWLGRGWNSRVLPGEIYNNPPVRAQADITLKSGQKTQIVTDESWKCHPSPITPLDQAFSDRYGGERYDGRRELADWNSVGLDDSKWQSVRIMNAVNPVMAAQMVQPNRIQEILHPVAIKELPKGVYQIDMGRNYSGWLKLHIRGGQPGEVVKLEYGDKIMPDSRLQSYSQRDEYVLNDKPKQSFCSRFNYHAFRWVRISGLSTKPKPSDAVGYFIHTNYKPTSEFECSNTLLNRIYRTVNWTYRCLTLGGYIVDCPHRQRLGYGGDAGTSMETGMNNFEVAALYTKWLGDWRLVQDEATGNLPHTAPTTYAAGGGPAWSGICVTLPWELYRYYGDVRILALSYPMMQKWLSFLESKSKDNLLEPYLAKGHGSFEWCFLGDWVPPGRGQMPSQRVDEYSTLFFNNCYYLYNVQLAAKIAAVLGKADDAAAYEKKGQALKQAIQQRFYNAEKNTYANGEQTYLAMPLLFGIVPENRRGGIMEKLANDILVKHQGHLNTGMHGTYFMLKLLNQQNRDDLIYEITNQTSYPGWGYMLGQGATTIWEEWNGNNSQIHDTLLAVGAWFINGVGGIRPDDQQPGFKQFIIKPAVVGDLNWACASYNSIHGKIVSRWKKDKEQFTLKVQIPVNTTATVHVPAGSGEVITEGKRPADQAEGVEFLRWEGKAAVYRVGSGKYTFVAIRK